MDKTNQTAKEKEMVQNQPHSLLSKRMNEDQPRDFVSAGTIKRVDYQLRKIEKTRMLEEKGMTRGSLD